VFDSDASIWSDTASAGMLRGDSNPMSNKSDTRERSAILIVQYTGRIYSTGDMTPAIKICGRGFLPRGIRNSPAIPGVFPQYG
jgi:hypothetical protein